MSIELMARVWKIELSHSQQSILLAMADVANDDGRNCYPSHRLLAWKTGYSERQIARIINELIESGIVKVIKLGTNNHPPRYWIQLEKGKPKKPYKRERSDDDEFRGDKLSPQEIRDDILSPLNGDEEDDSLPPNEAGDDRVSPQDVAFVAPGGDTLSPDPSVNHQLQPPEQKEEGIVGATPTGSPLGPLDDGWPTFLAALCWVCHGHQNVNALTKKQLGALTAEGKKLREDGYTMEDLRDWVEQHWRKDWRWENGQQRPEPHIVRSSIPILRESDSNGHSYSKPNEPKRGSFRPPPDIDPLPIFESEEITP